MEFRKKECQRSPIFAKKMLKRWLLICGFCKADLRGTLRPAILRGAMIFSPGRADVQPATKLEAEDSLQLATSQGLREIIRRTKSAMRFSGRLERRMRVRPQLREMAESSLA